MRRWLVPIVLGAMALPAMALEYRSVAEPAILYNAPATTAGRQFIIARYTPVEVVVPIANWTGVLWRGSNPRP
jgi:hypothetical protein